MLIPFNDDILKNGFCRGMHEPKIDEESRLHLPKKDVLDILDANGVKELYRCPDPMGKRFILCPAQHWDTFVNAITKYFSESSDMEQALRCVFSGMVASPDSHGRIRITKVCFDHADVNIGERVRMLGMGLWYEISSFKNRNAGH